MIKINGKEIKVERYPDGTQKIDFDIDDIVYSAQSAISLRIHWIYENDGELFTLICLKKHLDLISEGSNLLFTILIMNYLPNARMDRVKNSDKEIFTLKYFADIINYLNFNRVCVLDAHSNVSTALINNCNDQSYILPEIVGTGVLQCELDLTKKDIVLYYPDFGAYKKYSEIFKDYKSCFGKKKRDWETGKILGLDVETNDIDLKDKTILMVDDIISYGGSMYYSALKLKELSVGKIYCYATHTEDSVLDKDKGTLIKLINDGVVEKLFTTDSLFKGSHERIEVIKV